MNTKPKTHRPKLTYSNVMATAAVFLAMGGTGALAATHLGRASVGTQQLKSGAVTGAKVKDGSLSGADLNASTLGRVPAAANAERAATAGRADSAAHADTAATATSATSADRAAVAASLAPDEAVHYLGSPGEPQLQTLFKAHTAVGFYRDHEGVVHLEGQVESAGEFPGALFRLPDSYRPQETETFFGVTAKSPSHVAVEPSGWIEIYGFEKGEPISLDGITWKADDRTEA